MAAKDKERRRFKRILFDAPAEVITPRQLYPTSVVDVSLRGALLQRPPDWHPVPSEGVLLEILLDKDNHRIRMHAEVAHIEPETIGMECRHIDVESIAHLRRLVELNVGDSAILERELAALG